MNSLRILAILLVYFGNLASTKLYINRHNFGRYSAPYEPRFPSYITDPLVQCPKSDYFVHPRDCNWFYRCHDPIVKGYYQRYYIQCPFGTTFNSTIKLCDLNHDDNCNGIPYEFILPPTTAASSSSPTEPATPGPSVVTSKPITVTSESTSSATESSTTELTDPTNELCSECFQNSDNCVDYTVCPSPSRKKISMRLCSTAYEFCPPCAAQTPLCQDGEYFSPHERTCHSAPTSASMACSYSVPCTFDGEKPELSFVTEKYCKPYKDCVDGSKTKEKLCSRFVVCSHFPDNAEEFQWEVKFSSCPEANMLYSYVKKQCVTNPEEKCKDLPNGLSA